MKNKKPSPRRQITWNTGQRVHRPRKGKGSYRRKKTFDIKHSID